MCTFYLNWLLLIHSALGKQDARRDLPIVINQPLLRRNKHTGPIHCCSPGKIRNPDFGKLRVGGSDLPCSRLSARCIMGGPPAVGASTERLGSGLAVADVPAGRIHALGKQALEGKW